MTHRHRRSLLALLGSASLAVIAGAAPSVAHGKSSVSPASTRTAHVITLVTGQRILEGASPDGRPTFSALSGGSGMPLFTFEVKSTWYAVPAIAMHAMGAQLDPTLFDTAALTQAEAGTSGQIRVQVQWHGSTAPAMPWLQQATTVAAGVTDGVVTSASGAALQAALSAGPLAGVDRISLVGASPASPPPSPGFVMYTLTVRGIDATGAPDNGDIAVFLNTDNAIKSNGFGQWYHGVFKVSVPVGHYALVGNFASFATGAISNGGGPPPSATLQMVVKNFTVRGNTTVTVDARAATARVDASTPLPTDVGSGNLTWQRTDAASTGGTSFGVGWPIGGGAGAFKVYVSPGPKPAVGTQGLLTSFHLDSPATSAHAYSYDLSYGTLGAIAPVQHHVVSPSQLATVATEYFSDTPNQQSLESRLSFFPWQFFSSGTFDPITAPLARTEYLSAASDLVWVQQVVEDANTFNGFSFDSLRVFAPGEATQASWNRNPIGPGVPVDAGPTPPFLQFCPACTESGQLEFAIAPFGDNPPGHYGQPYFPAPGVTETDAFNLLRNGTSTASGADPLGIIVPVGSTPAHYQLQYNVSASAPWQTLSTNAMTSWGFATPTSTSAPVPSGWVCASGTGTGCDVIALMLPDYQLPEDGTGHVAEGAVTFQLGISHILGVSLAVTSAQVSVSFDGGKTWSAATVTSRGANLYAVSYTDPAHPGTAAIRVHITDAGGGVLDQTILNAYAIS